MVSIMKQLGKHNNFVSDISAAGKTGMEGEEDAPCDVCRSPESEDKNEIVLCESCKIWVHQGCYGITTIPEGDWYCKPCQINVKPSCIFCPNKGGAMKQTTGGQWGHVSCTIWIREVCFAVPEMMDVITNISKIPKSRWSLLCSLCRNKKGACIQCHDKRCRVAYHVTCAFQHGLEMKMEDIETSEKDIKLESYCRKHGKNDVPGKKERNRKNVKNSKRKNSSNARCHGNVNGESTSHGHEVITAVPNENEVLEITKTIQEESRRLIKQKKVQLKALDQNKLEMITKIMKKTNTLLRTSVLSQQAVQEITDDDVAVTQYSDPPRMDHLKDRPFTSATVPTTYMSNGHENFRTILDSVGLRPVFTEKQTEQKLVKLTSPLADVEKEAFEVLKRKQTARKSFAEKISRKKSGPVHLGKNARKRISKQPPSVQNKQTPADRNQHKSYSSQMKLNQVKLNENEGESPSIRNKHLLSTSGESESPSTRKEDLHSPIDESELPSTRKEDLHSTSDESELPSTRKEDLHSTSDESELPSTRNKNPLSTSDESKSHSPRAESGLPLTGKDQSHSTRIEVESPSTRNEDQSFLTEEQFKSPSTTYENKQLSIENIHQTSSYRNEHKKSSTQYKEQPSSIKDIHRPSSTGKEDQSLLTQVKHLVTSTQSESPFRQSPNSNQSSPDEVRTVSTQRTVSRGMKRKRSHIAVNDFAENNSNLTISLNNTGTNVLGSTPNAPIAELKDRQILSVGNVTECSNNHEEFAKYIVSLLRTIPPKRVFKVQKKVISIVMKEHHVSSSDEFDISSVSSD